MTGGHDHSHSHSHTPHYCHSVGHHDHGDHDHSSPSVVTGNERSNTHSSPPPSSKKEESDKHQAEVMRRLKMAMLLCGSFFVVEVLGGYFSGSLAVLSDAAHLFADLASFAVAIAAAHLASLPPTDNHTFGLKRTESLAALLSMISLALVSVYLAAEAIRRLYIIVAPNKEGDEVNGKLMSQVAAIGVLVNLALAWVLGVENHIHLPGADHDHSHDHDHGHQHNHQHDKNGHDNSHSGHCHDYSSHEANSVDHSHEHRHHSCNQKDIEATPLLETKQHHNCQDGHDHSHQSYESVEGKEGKTTTKPLRNVNLHAAYLHVIGDLLQSLGVLIAGLVIWYNPDWACVDPICTLFFCAIVFYSTLSVLRSSVSVLLQEIPANLSWQQIYSSIENVEGVKNVHDLHVWSISHGNPALAVHCSTDGDPQEALRRITTVLQQEFGIDHITIQIQHGNGDCITCERNAGCDTARLEERNSSLSKSSRGNNESNNNN